jgi:hypothetical protein
MDCKIQTPRLAMIMTAILGELQRQEDFWGMVIVGYDYDKLIKILVDDNAQRYGVKINVAGIDVGNYKTDLDYRLARAMLYYDHYLHLEQHQTSELLTLKLDLIGFLRDLKKVPLSYD